MKTYTIIAELYHGGPVGAIGCEEEEELFNVEVTLSIHDDCEVYDSKLTNVIRALYPGNQVSSVHVERENGIQVEG